MGQAPIRIQRKRTKGFKLPPGTVCISRPGKWGNPFQVGGWFKVGTGGNGFAWLHWHEVGDVEMAIKLGYKKIENNIQAIEMYKALITNYASYTKDINTLAGKTIACWCKVGEPCHGDELIRIFNEKNKWTGY